MMFCKPTRTASAAAGTAKHTPASPAGPLVRPTRPRAARAVVWLVTAAAAVAAGLLAWSPAALAQPAPALAEVPLARLQAMVLACDLKAHARDPATAATAFCAAAAEELQQRAFSGSRERLLAWWLAARAAQHGTPASAPSARAPGALAEGLALATTRSVGGAPLRLQDATPAQLKTAYLECNRLAETTLLDFGTAASCSMVYEALKLRVFGGDFQRLLAWSREQRAAAATGDTEAAR